MLSCNIIFTFNISDTPITLEPGNTIKSSEFAAQLMNPPDAIEMSQINQLHVKQGTDLWLRLRKCAVFTGSTLYKGLGLSPLCDQQQFLREHLHNGEFFF